jgi:hypothetical protein
MGEITTDTLAIARMDERMKHLEESMKQVLVQLEAVNKTLGEARGGWKTLVFVAGVAASVGGLVTWVINVFHIKGPT